MSENINDIAQHDDRWIRVGQMLRLLHDNLCGLGLDKLLERAAEDISDARYRLDYVANMFKQAAHRLLNATDRSVALQKCLDAGAEASSLKSQSTSIPSISLLKYQQLTGQVFAYLILVNTNTLEAKTYRLAIKKAQDFQDFTGQVIRSIAELIQNFESQLIQFLIKYSPDFKKCKVVDGLFNEPQIIPEGRPMWYLTKGKLIAC